MAKDPKEIMKPEGRTEDTGMGIGDIAHLRTWIGRTETASDVATAAPLGGLCALLDYAEWPWAAGTVPPLGHWLYFLPRARQSLLDADGHARRGGFLPPVALPRRMWAGGRVRLHAPIAIGALLERLSTIANVVAKSGASGSMVFVTVRHEIIANGSLSVTEEQDLVYREASMSASPPRDAATNPAKTDTRSAPRACRTISADAAMLFRYSALTFNAHRIHYDRDYARDVEYYPGLVVQGPLLATLLLDGFMRRKKTGAVKSFAFRALRPVYDAQTFEVCVGEPAQCTRLWIQDEHGALCMTADVTG
jgi:3-methylfumaryl-CoA hydratase